LTKEVLFISGKGGTGKTSLTAAFAHLAGRSVICDLDVDAPDLHLLLQPEVETSEPFISGHTARITDACDGCGFCLSLCRFDAIEPTVPRPTVNTVKCEGCNLCVTLCPNDAIAFPDTHCGDWYVSRTRFGPMLHAQLFPGEENSGRLVALLKRQARKLAEKQGHDLIISDGPPGIGCPVISALSGTDLAVVITEPTPSGKHDLLRIIDLCDHFQLPAAVLINKADLNLEETRRIRSFCRQHPVPLVAELPHTPEVTRAMVQGKVITEWPAADFSSRLQQAWTGIQRILGETGRTEAPRPQTAT